MANVKEKILPLDHSDPEFLKLFNRFVENPHRERALVLQQTQFAADGQSIFRGVYSTDAINGCRVNQEGYDVNRVTGYLRDYCKKARFELCILAGTDARDVDGIKYLGSGSEALPEGSKPVFMCLFPLVQLNQGVSKAVNPGDMVVMDCRRFGQSKIPKSFYGAVLYLTWEKVDG